MTAQQIVNGAPMTIFRKINDISTRALVPEVEQLPAHLAKVYGFAQWGPKAPQLVSGNSRLSIYGADSFDMRKKWATHATVLSNVLNAAGNSQMFERVIPADAAAPANFRLYLDIVEAEVPEYERNDDGSIKLDNTGAKIETGNMLQGHKAKWVVAPIAVGAGGENMIGMGTQVPGDQVAAGEQSTRYPWFDFEVPHQGARGNNMGVRIWAPTLKSSNAVDDRIIKNEAVYPFRISLVERADINSTAKVVETLTGEQFVNLALKPGVLDRNTDTMLYVGDELIKKYEKLDISDGTPRQWGPFGRIYVYDQNIATVLKMVYDAEYPHSDEENFDFTGEDGEEYRFNVFSGVSSLNVPYHTYILDDTAANAQRLSENSNIFAQGGSDGTISEAVLNILVKEAVAEYANENSEFQDMALYPESILYDSGFELETKKALCQFIAIRPDTAVVLSTHDVLGKKLTASEESSLAIALRTRLQAYPESEFYGTATTRGVVVGRSGVMLNTQYNKRLPLTIELANKAARYMGAGNGRWKPGFGFDRSPANQITMFTDINIVTTPAAVRHKDWDNGLVWVEMADMRKAYFPAVRTVYDNDTSVLTSFFTMMACVELEKVGDRARRTFNGSSYLTNAQLVERVNEFVIANTTGRFDDRFEITPDTYFTAADLARGYSWSLKIGIRAPNMKTVQTLIIEADRIDEATTA